MLLLGRFYVARKLVEPHQRGLCRLSSLPVARADILHCGSDAAVSERLSDQGEIHVFRHKVRGEGVFQSVRMSLVPRQAGSFGARSEDAEELCAVELATFLRREQKIRTISRPRLKPGSEGCQFIE
jgi:hypothetical protein